MMKTKIRGPINSAKAMPCRLSRWLNCPQSQARASASNPNLSKTLVQASITSAYQKIALFLELNQFIPPDDPEATAPAVPMRFLVQRKPYRSILNMRVVLIQHRSLHLLVFHPDSFALGAGGRSRVLLPSPPPKSRCARATCCGQDPGRAIAL